MTARATPSLSLARATTPVPLVRRAALPGRVARPSRAARRASRVHLRRAEGRPPPREQQRPGAELPHVRDELHLDERQQ